MINVTELVSIPEHELTFTASRSSGPGGQNVNKVNSRVTVRFDVATSPSLSEAQKRHILSRLSTRVSHAGVLQVVSQQYRSQTANRQAAVARLSALLHQALTPVPTRKKTTVPPAAKQRRLEEKKHRSRLKQLRAQNRSWDQ